MVIGTWKHSVEQKKKSISLSHLPEYEKERLCNLLEKIETKSNVGKYENHKDKAGYIGMFGTGFYSFKSNEGEYVAKKFIKLCIDIIDLDDDNDIYKRAENCFRSELKGIKAASASAMLHCLKPYTFPILNTNSGSNTIYEYFKVPLQNMKLLTTYASNCRMIKEFRDKYFYVKNYKIDFKPNIFEYELVYSEIPENLEIKAIAENDDAEVIIENNKNLEDGSIILIKSRISDTIERVYKLKITKKEVIEHEYNKTIIMILIVVLLITMIILFVSQIKEKKNKKIKIKKKKKIEKEISEIEVI